MPPEPAKSTPRDGSRTMRRLMLLCLLVLAGCANSAGIAEFAAYRGSFQELRASATPLFDLLEVEERERMEGKKRDHVDRRATEDFVVKDAAIYSTLTEPPLTTAYRRSFDVVTRYNTVMAGLANGQRGSELAADAASLA